MNMQAVQMWVKIMCLILQTYLFHVFSEQPEASLTDMN